MASSSQPTKQQPEQGIQSSTFIQGLASLPSSSFANNAIGCRSKQNPLTEEEFHQYMADAWNEQRLMERLTKGDREIYEFSENSHLTTRLPRRVYKAFWQYLKDQAWSKSKGIQFAIVTTLRDHGYL